ncbi:MAG: SDR family NAD(P)-dependent oxidoreductase, partial [Acidobacteriaceae bacterium]|nr:SDR family NAD(P)-dependent oxidoreductase [Acidobacteriaceae bacterium]
MSESLAGKRALVTGGSKGIGLAVARALATAGANVVICARDNGPLDRAVEDLKSAAKGAKVAGRTADVSDAQEVARLFGFVDEQLGGLDILVNNAGVGVFRAV